MASILNTNKKVGDLNYAAAAATMTLHGECPIFGHTDCGYPYSMHCTAICCGRAMRSNQRSHRGHGRSRSEADTMVLGRKNTMYHSLCSYVCTFLVYRFVD